jgi:hypothetical protein
MKIKERKKLVKDKDIVAFRTISRQRSQTNRVMRQQSARNNRGTVGNGVFYGGPSRNVITATRSEVNSVYYLKGSVK